MHMLQNLGENQHQLVHCCQVLCTECPPSLLLCKLLSVQLLLLVLLLGLSL
jgi:hypothetical protein